MTHSTDNRVSPFRSTFAVGVGIVALASAIVCGILFMISAQMTYSLASSTHRDKAHDVTLLQSQQLGGAVRFKDDAGIAQRVDEMVLLGGEDLVNVGVFGADGMLLAEAGNAFSLELAPLVEYVIAQGTV